MRKSRAEEWAPRYDAIVTELEGRGENVYSQFGEDGLIEAAFEMIGTTNKWCFEFGADDGVFCSNTLHLVLQGWNAVWIEADADNFASLMADKPERVRAYNEKVTPANVDELLLAGGLPAEPDLGVIDVDGMDLLIWHGMRRVVPRLLLIEFSPYAADQETLVDGKQAPMGPVWRYGEMHGYTVLAKTFCNLLFARSELISDV